MNLSQINGLLTSSPWIAQTPFFSNLVSLEWCMGIFPCLSASNIGGSFSIYNFTIVVTNVGVYYAAYPNTSAPTAPNPVLTLLHTWMPGEIAQSFTLPGNAVSFCEVNGTVYFTGLALSGIFSVTANGIGATPIFAQATSYVSGVYIIELGGRLVVAQCRFPTGGGTGTNVLPTVAWSGAGEYAGSGGSDPWNPVNNLGGGFNQLADVPDQITGLAGIGRSALIFRNNGVSQMDPNPGTSNSGIQPFDFYHLWASAQGVGAYPGTVAQFGQTVTFRSSDNVYQISISGGLAAVGNRIITALNNDLRTLGNLFGPRNAINDQILNSSWYFASIVEIAGQLHYLLTFSGLTINPDSGAPITTAQSTAIVYDFNLSENAWHVWYLADYFDVNGNVSDILAFSCPIAQVQDVVTFVTTLSGARSISGIFSPSYILFGTFTTFGTLLTSNPAGQISQFVPWDYDFNSNWITPYIAGLYQPHLMPQSTIVFRAEVISLGHKISTRRVRIQADNAPLPSFETNAQQQSQAVLTGMLAGNTQKAPLAWTQNAGAGQPVPYMQGNYAPQGQAIQTYYADMVLSDEMVQPSIQGLIANPNRPWDSLPAFRIATASLVLVDATATTQ